MRIEHDSHKSFFRNPFGAVKCGETITLRVAVSSYSIPESVKLLIGEKEVNMYYVFEMSGTRLYECTIKTPDTEGLLWYSFYAFADGGELWYGNNDLMLGGLGENYNSFPTKQFQITVYDKDFTTPDWIKNAVVYQIFPDRFYRSGDTPYHGIKRQWGDEPFYLAHQFGGEYLSNDFFGGTLRGIEEKLPYLCELGVTAIYLNPIFKAFSNHRYDTGDYENVDDTLGTNEDFISLASAAKEKGIHLILDGVFSHTGADSRYFNRYGHYDSVGAYQSKESPYYSWYSFSEYPDKYDSWWGFITLPNTHELDEKFVKYILENDDSIIKRWIENGGNGWRLDVADELPDEFIKKLRAAVKEKDENAVIIGEVWEDASNKVSYGAQREFLWGKSLDGVMNYVFRGAVLDYLKDCDSHLFSRRMVSMQENYPAEALYASLSLISTHDVPRALTILSNAPSVENLDRQAQKDVWISPEDRALGVARLKLAFAIQMTFPGAACVYYGDEIGMCGYADPFNRRTFDWDRTDCELHDTLKLYAKLRNEHPALRTGELTFVYASNGAVCYMRSITGAKDKFGTDAELEAFLICVNASPNKTERMNLGMGRFNVVFACDIFTGENVERVGTHFRFDIAPLSVRIFTLERSNGWYAPTEYPNQEPKEAESENV